MSNNNHLTTQFTKTTTVNCWYNTNTINHCPSLLARPLLGVAIGDLLMVNLIRLNHQLLILIKH